MIRRPPRSTRVRSSAASDVYKRQLLEPFLSFFPSRATGRPVPPILVCGMWFSLFERGPPTAIHSTFLATPGTTTASAHPLGIVGGAVKLRCGLEGFVVPGQGGRPRLREQSGYLGLIQRPECARGFHRLIEPFHALASGDHHGNR